MTNCLDLSNYTDHIDVADAQRWKDAGIKLVIIQTIDPPAGYPSGRTQQQIETCLAAGIAVDIYVWDWVSLGAQDILNKLALVRPYQGRLREVWVDAEDTAPASVESRIESLREACSLVDGSGIFTKAAGIYTGGWYWRAYMANTTEFGDRELWDSDYDHVADSAYGWQPYGGWTERAIKQHIGSSAFEGIGGIDQNVLSIEELGEVEGVEPGPTPEPGPPEVPCPDLVNALGYIRGDLARMLLDESKRRYVRKTVVRNIATQIQAVATDALG